MLLTHLTLVQSVQAFINPLLHIQPPLQLLPVVFDGNPGMPLGDVTTMILEFQILRLQLVPCLLLGHVCSVPV